MRSPNSPQSRRSFLKRGSATVAGSAVAGGLPLLTLGADAALAADAAALSPVVRENTLTDQSLWSTGYAIDDGQITGVVTGYARRPSINLGESLDLVVAGPNRYLADPGEDLVETVDIELFRLGYYGGAGSRLTWSSPSPVSTFQRFDRAGNPSNDGDEPAAAPYDDAVGLNGRAGYHTSTTIPPEAFPESGVYLAKLHARWLDFPPGVPAVEQSGQTHVVIVVRDDLRPRDVLAVLPTNTWQAYNYFGGRSLYTYNSLYEHMDDDVPATGTPRAAKVSLDRPYNNWIGDLNWVLRADFPAIYWLEQQGYDVAYTEDTAFHFNPAQGLPGHSKSVAIIGHGEYWSKEIRDGLEAARDSGVSIFNFGANTGYWQVRYETADQRPATSLDEARVLVCYKTIEGGGATQPGIASKADPVSPTTTFRDPGRGPGITPGTTGATPPVYEGVDRPERGLLGVQYIGDDDAENHLLAIPADNGQGEFAGHRAWRHTSFADGRGGAVHGGLLGWEWDGVPEPGQPFYGPDPVVKDGTSLQRLYRSNPTEDAPDGNVTVYLTDAGRSYSSRGAGAAPPAGWQTSASGVTYTAPSGALVWSSGTIQWSWGLGPHHLDQDGQTYSDGRTDASVPEIQQATANILSDGGIYPATPAGVVIDPITPVDTTPPKLTASVTNPYLAILRWYAVSEADRLLGLRFVVDSAEQSSSVHLVVTVQTGAALLAAGSADVQPGFTYDIPVLLTKNAFARVKSKVSIPATLKVTATDAAGNTTKLSRNFRLRATS